MAHSGGCLCGKVRYEIGAEPITVRVCWCCDCQKFGAGGPTVNAAFPSSALKVTGELRDYPSTADSGNKMHRKFCPRAAHISSAKPKCGRISSTCGLAL